MFPCRGTGDWKAPAVQIRGQLAGLGGDPTSKQHELNAEEKAGFQKHLVNFGADLQELEPFSEASPRALKSVPTEIHRILGNEPRQLFEVKHLHM